MHRAALARAARKKNTTTPAGPSVVRRRSIMNNISNIKTASSRLHVADMDMSTPRVSTDKMEQ